MRFECEIQARIRDLNAGAHVDSVEVMRVIDEGRAQFFGVRREAGPAAMLGVLSGVPLGVAPLAASHQVEYRQELSFKGHHSYALSIWVARIGRTSLTVDTELRTPWADNPDLIRAVGETTVVFVDHSTGSPWEIDEELRTTLTPYLGAPVRFRPRSQGR